MFLTLWPFSVAQELKGISELHSEWDNFGKKSTQTVRLMQQSVMMT